MKKNILALALFMGVCSVGFAQRGNGGGNRGDRQKVEGQRRGEAPNPEERVQKMTEKMKTELGLSEQQYNDVLKLNTDRQAKMMGKREEMHAEMKEKHAEMQEERKAENDAYLAQLQKVLSPEQFEKFKTQMEAKKGDMERKMQERGEGKMPKGKKRGH